MRKEDKGKIIEAVAAQLAETPNFYVTDISGLNAEDTTTLRKSCFEKEIKLLVVKNTLFREAMKKSSDASLVEEILPTLKGNTAIMFTTVPNAPAKLIKDLGGKLGKPVLKGACVQECTYIGANQLDVLVNIKSREELIGEIITLLQSPVKNVVSALQSNAGGKVAGLVKAVEVKAK